jgi:hypothetical protein
VKSNFITSILKGWGDLAGDLGFKIHGFALGLTLALAAPLLAQGCTAGGQ